MSNEPPMSTQWTRRGIIVAGVLAAAAGAMPPAIGRAQHLNKREPGTQKAVTPKDIDQRLEQRIADIRRIAPRGADRYILFDLAYPQDPQEYREVGRTARVLAVP